MIARRNVPRDPLLRRHPFALLAVCLLWILASLAWLDPLFQALSLAIVLIALRVGAATPLRAMIRPAAWFALFGLGMVTTALLYREDGGYLARVAGLATSAADDGAWHERPAVRAALALFLRAMTCGMASFLFVRAIDPSELGKALITDARLPARFAYAVGAALNAAAALPEELRLARMAQAMRTDGGRRRWPSLAANARVLVLLLARAIRRAGGVALAMEAKGFRADRAPTPLDPPVWGRADTLFVLGGAAALMLAVMIAL